MKQRRYDNRWIDSTDSTQKRNINGKYNNPSRDWTADATTTTQRGATCRRVASDKGINMSHGADHSKSGAKCNNTSQMDSCNNNLMDKRTSKMAGRTATIDNNSNDGKSIVTCDNSSLAGAYNNSPASIMRSSNNNKATAA